MRRKRTSRRTTTKPIRSRRRKTSAIRWRSVDAIRLGAQSGGILGLLFLIYGLFEDKLPESMAAILPSGFALSIGVVLLIVAISLHFSQEAGWLDRERPKARRTTRTRYYRRRRT